MNKNQENKSGMVTQQVFAHVSAFNASSQCSASIQTPENTQWMCHNQYNLLKIILQVVEDSKLIEGSSIIWCVFA